MAIASMRTELEELGYVIVLIDEDPTTYSMRTPRGDESLFVGDDALQQVVAAGVEDAGLN